MDEGSGRVLVFDWVRKGQSPLVLTACGHTRLTGYGAQIFTKIFLNPHVIHFHTAAVELYAEEGVWALM